jgi:hypothetical protein
MFGSFLTGKPRPVGGELHISVLPVIIENQNLIIQDLSPFLMSRADPSIPHLPPGAQVLANLFLISSRSTFFRIFPTGFLGI